ncbi:MAG TPA: hypothetical protein VFE62_09215 [Gemmataceae bacterium]|nr:hypothetical protein [Gemmataceae bacterium]
MTWHHFAAFLWLRWRLFSNQFARGGVLTKIFLILAAVGAALSAVTMLIGSFFAGLFLLPTAQPIVVLLVWDGATLLFLLSWSVGLMTELQRSESLSLDKFLHLPVSLSAVFSLNYLTSLVCMTTIVWAPALLGLALGQAFGSGATLALVLPAAVSFIFMVTALSYQFQGWLASLMVNKRRRRTIVVIVTLFFVLIFQIPNLINLLHPWQGVVEQRKEALEQQKTALDELDRALKAHEITEGEYIRRATAIRHEQDSDGEATLQRWQDAAWIANMVVPIGWLAWGAATAREGNMLPCMLAIIAYTLVGTASLWRGYRTTVRIYTGEFTARGPDVRAVPVAQGSPLPAAPATAPGAALLELSIPWLSDQAAATALAGFRSLTRAPEVKMLLLTPIIMVVVVGGIVLRESSVSEALRPLIAFGITTTVLITFTQLVGNQFGHDRSGFRAFLLSPAPRREVLLGKNLAIAPIFVALALPVIILFEIFLPLPLDELLAMPLRLASMFMIFCMGANLLSILAPMPVAVGSLKPLSPKVLPLLLHMLFVIAMPFALMSTLLPLGIKVGWEAMECPGVVPIYLLLTALEFLAIGLLFRVVLTWEGRLLQAREQVILETVVAKAE